MKFKYTAEVIPVGWGDGISLKLTFDDGQIKCLSYNKFRLEDLRTDKALDTFLEGLKEELKREIKKSQP